MAEKNLVSIILVCYNHAKYLTSSIASILGQSYERFELIVIDNSSSDESFQILNQYHDSRIKIYTLENLGPSYAFNFGIKKSQGHFLCFVSGDDMYGKDFLSNNLKFIVAESKDIVFSNPKLIGEHDEELSEQVFPVFFNTKFINNYDLFRNLFYQTNFICAPSAFFRRTVFDKVGNFKNSLLQLQDYDYWLRAASSCNVAFLNSIDVRYRIRENDRNLSTIKNNSRTQLELVRVFEDIFSSSNEEFLFNSFPEFLNSEMNKEEITIGLSKIYISHSNLNIQRIGFQKLSRLIDDDSAFNYLRQNINFNLVEYFEVANYLGKNLLT